MRQITHRDYPSLPTVDVTAAEYAKQHGCSVSTAHRRLKALVYAGQATWTNGYIHHQPSRLRDIKTPPPALVIYYTITRTA